MISSSTVFIYSLKEYSSYVFHTMMQCAFVPWFFVFHKMVNKSIFHSMINCVLYNDLLSFVQWFIEFCTMIYPFSTINPFSTFNYLSSFVQWFIKFRTMIYQVSYNDLSSFVQWFIKFHTMIYNVLSLLIHYNTNIK